MSVMQMLYRQPASLCVCAICWQTVLHSAPNLLACSPPRMSPHPNRAGPAAGAAAATAGAAAGAAAAARTSAAHAAAALRRRRMQKGACAAVLACAGMHA